jgi:sulfonate transport system substrate-binding protein
MTNAKASVIGITRRRALDLACGSVAAAWAFAATRAAAQGKPDTMRIGFQRSSTLITILKTNGELEKALAPVGLWVTWHEFTSGLPLLEALNIGGIDFSADVADTVPIFAQAAGAKLVYVAEEAPSPTAQAIVVPAASPIRTLADLKGKRVAVTKGAGSHFLLLAALGSVGLTFRDISPAYLTPADGRAAFVSGSVQAWVAWDPFLSSALRQTGATVLADGAGLASYKRYYLASDDFARRRADALNVVFAKLQATGAWVKQHPDEAAALLAGIWGIDAATVAQANRNRSYQVDAVTPQGLAEQQKIADVFFADGLIPRKVDAKNVQIWQPA